MPRPAKLLGEYQLELQQDPDTRNRYDEDQRSALRDSGLTEDQQAILLSRDLARIKDAVDAEYREADDADPDPTDRSPWLNGEHMIPKPPPPPPPPPVRWWDWLTQWFRQR
jgi:hypothetical protein